MTRWLIELNGEPFDTDEFVYWFPDGEEVFGLSEGKHRYLTGPAFQTCSEAECVDEMANQYIDEMLSVIVLLQAGVKRPTIGKIILENSDGSRETFALAQGHSHGRAKLRAQLIPASQPKSPTEAQQFLQVVRTNRNLQAALSLLALPNPTWPHLYRCMEELELFLKTPVNVASLCSAAERERFRQTANNAEAAGLNARHGLGKFSPPTKPMALSEARGFVTGLAQAVIRATLTRQSLGAGAV